MVRRSLADDSYGRGPFAWSIELCEVKTLPRAERYFSVTDCERHAVADEDCFDVRRAVPFGMRVFRIAGDHSLERREEVLLHIRVGVLVDEDRRGRMCDGHGYEPITYLRACHCGLHTRRDIDRLLALVRLDGDRFVPDRHASAASRCAAILAMSAGVAFPPLTTRIVRRPWGTYCPAMMAVSSLAAVGSPRRT